MAAGKIFRIRPGFLIPLAADVFLLAFLLGYSFLGKSEPVERIVLTIVFVPLCLVFIELLMRQIEACESGIRIKRFIRKKELLWGDITEIGSVVLRNKVYIVLTTKKGFYVISNSYENFTSLVKYIVDHLDKDRIEEGVSNLVLYPVRKMADIVSAWIAAVILLIIVFTKLFF
ncbi:MAG: hypothetical protein ABFD62_16815 [Syntrophaceae bacterium]